MINVQERKKDTRFITPVFSLKNGGNEINYPIRNCIYVSFGINVKLFHDLLKFVKKSLSDEKEVENITGDDKMLEALEYTKKLIINFDLNHFHQIYLY